MALSDSKMRPPPERAKRAIWGWWARVARPVGGIVCVVCSHCGGSSECPDGYVCIRDGGGGTGGGGSVGGSGTGGNGGEGGAGGGVPAGCDLVEGEAVGAECGVFVKAEATGDGTQGSPYGTIQDAVDNIKTATRIYVCGGDTFDGSIELPGGVSLYGGLNCADWTFAAVNPQPTILGDSDVPALSILESGGSTVGSMKIQGAPAVAQGGSSIGALVGANATAHFERCSLGAGKGAAGAPGEPQSKAPTPAAANGGPGDDGCLGAGGTLGGAPGTQTCQSGLSGGSGGNGLNDTDGVPGAPGHPAGPNNIGGKEETLGAPTACGNGGEGDPGMHGNPGPGALESELGLLEGTTFSGASGSPGLGTGTPGQGGGGGGGANACGGAGPGGGGGGAGGCGGLAGNGGGGGGGSFALVSIQATVTLTDVRLSADEGGIGGQGDAGQEGMDGGIAGTQGAGGGACAGGPGGKGGQGGAGGGGRGGPSVGIAYVGDAPTEEGTIMIDVAETPAAGGTGGNGGPGNIGGVGATGIAQPRQEF